MSKPRYLRGSQWGTDPAVPVEHVPRTENEETQRAMRDWLRERDDESAIDFEPDPVS